MHNVCRHRTFSKCFYKRYIVQITLVKITIIAAYTGNVLAREASTYTKAWNVAGPGPDRHRTGQRHECFPTRSYLTHTKIIYIRRSLESYVTLIPYVKVTLLFGRSGRLALVETDVSTPCGRPSDGRHVTLRHVTSRHCCNEMIWTGGVETPRVGRTRVLDVC